MNDMHLTITNAGSDGRTGAADGGRDRRGGRGCGVRVMRGTGSGSPGAGAMRGTQGTQDGTRGATERMVCPYGDAAGGNRGR